MAPASGAEQLTGTGLNNGLVACKPKARLGCILNMRVGYMVLVVIGFTKLNGGSWSILRLGLSSGPEMQPLEGARNAKIKVPYFIDTHDLLSNR